MGWVRDLARGLVRSAAEADDVAQDVWLAASRPPPRSTSSVRAWLAAVTRNVVLTRRRSEARRQEREAAAARSEGQSSEHDVLVRGETCQRVVAAVMALDEPYRSTVLHRYLDGWSVGEIASREGVDEATVRKRLSRALQKLRAALDTEFGGGREAWMLALLDIARPARLGAVRPLAIALGGLIVMKKALVIGAAILVVACALWFTPARRLLGANRAPSSSTSVASELQSDGIIESQAPQRAQVADARAAIEDSAKPDSLSVDGVVVDLAYPDPSLPPTPAAGATVKLMRYGKGTLAQTQADVAGHFHLDLVRVSEGERSYGSVALFADGDERHRNRSITLNIDRGPTFPMAHGVGGPGYTEVAFKPGVPLTGLRLERATHGDVAGIVVGDDDRPLSGVTVQIRHAVFLGTSHAIDPDTEVKTDANGAFVFHNVHDERGFNSGTPLVTALGPGLRMVPSAPPAPLLRGGWRDVVIRMMATGGRMVVRVHDPDGRPEPGVRVGIGISKSEPAARWEQGLGSDVSSIQGDTDADGRVLLDDIWLGKRLALQVSRASEEWSRERAEQGVVDLRHADRGEHIIVPSSKSLQLDIVPPQQCLLRGKVIDAQGAAVANANILMRPRGAPIEGLNPWMHHTTDANGAFEQALRRPPHTFDLEVIAYTGGDAMESVLEFLKGPPGRMVDRQVVTIAPDASEETFVQLRVAPGRSISGRVTNADGTPCSGDIAAIPVGAYEGIYSWGSGPRLDKDGRFEITTLLPGVYDLDVRPEKHYVFTACLLTQRFTGIPAGSAPVDLVLREDHTVNVEIDVSSADERIAGMTVVTGLFYPYAVRDLSGHVPEHARSFPGTSGWPEGAILGMGGQSGASDAEAWTGFLHLRGEVPVHHCKPMNEGWYFIGIDATDADGQRFHPCGTGLVYLTSGDYHFHFDIDRQARVEGRIANADPGADLCVGLVTRDGRAVQVQRTTRHLAELVPVGSGGRFALDGAPVGEFRLRVGTEQQLRAGEFLQEVPVTVSTTNNTPLAIHLP
jgi:RNA polymerase sigma-70 factor (ECF subfamily)